MVNCGACGKFLSTVGAASCALCPLKYHKACLAISDKTNISRDWACPNCKRNIRRGDNSQTPVKGICVSPPHGEEPSECPSPKAEDGACEEALPNKELAQFMAEMREFRKEMVQLRDALSARLDTIERRLDKLEQRQPEAGVEGNAELERTIAELKQEINDRDQEALLSDLEIGQLPEEKGVSVVQSVTVLAARLGVTLEDRDVVFAERVGPPPAEAGGRARRVVVRLARRNLRDELIQAARARRSFTSAAEGRIFINERTDSPQPAALPPGPQS
ncbi:hypothetical protein ACJJTC_010181 [Scirpophaga incertulas]